MASLIKCYCLLVVGVFVAAATVTSADRIEPHVDNAGTSARPLASAEPSDAEFSPAGRSTKDWCLTQADLMKNSFVWTIDNFDMINEEPGYLLTSSQFPSNDPKWQLHLYPMGSTSEYRNYVSIFLTMSQDQSNRPTNAKFRIAILNDKHKRGAASRFEKPSQFLPGTTIGYSQFILRDVLFNKTAGLIPDGKLSIYCEVEVIGDMRTSCGQMINESQEPKCTLANDLGQLYGSERLSDLTVVVAGQEFKAHKAILAARTTVFDQLLAENTRLELADIEPEVFKEVLRYVYTGKPNLRLDATNEQQENLLEKDHFTIEVLRAAAKYQLDGLKLICEHDLYHTLSVESVVEVLKLAEEYHANWLKDKAIEYVNSHASELTENGGWNLLAKYNPGTLAEVLARQWPAKPATNVSDSAETI